MVSLFFHSGIQYHPGHNMARCNRVALNWTLRPTQRLGTGERHQMNLPWGPRVRAGREADAARAEAAARARTQDPGHTWGRYDGPAPCTSFSRARLRAYTRMRRAGRSHAPVVTGMHPGISSWTSALAHPDSSPPSPHPSPRPSGAPAPAPLACMAPLLLAATVGPPLHGILTAAGPVAGRIHLLIKAVAASFSP